MFEMSDCLSWRHFRWRSLRRPRPRVHVSSSRSLMKSSNSDWLRLVDLVDFAGHLSRTFGTAQDSSGPTNSSEKGSNRMTQWPNWSKRQTCSSFVNVISSTCSCLMWLRWGIKKLVDRLREEELKPFFVGLFPKDFDRSCCHGTCFVEVPHLKKNCRTIQRACVSPSTTSRRLVLESWQRRHHTAAETSRRDNSRFARTYVCSLNKPMLKPLQMPKRPLEKCENSWNGKMFGKESKS